MPMHDPAAVYTAEQLAADRWWIGQGYRAQPEGDPITYNQATRDGDLVVLMRSGSRWEFTARVAPQTPMRLVQPQPSVRLIRTRRP